MISRIHCMLELACRSSSGAIRLHNWQQGRDVMGRKISAPKMRLRQSEAGFQFDATSEVERLPVEPDALFSLEVTTSKGPVQSHFFFEADRGTMPRQAMVRKLRAYYHLIKKQQRHNDLFGIHPERAVLIETTDEQRGKGLMELVHHPLDCGPDRRAGLFWTTISPLFTAR
jgi:hypothetical protein